MSCHHIIHITHDNHQRSFSFSFFFSRFLFLIPTIFFWVLDWVKNIFTYCCSTMFAKVMITVTTIVFSIPFIFHFWEYVAIQWATSWKKMTQLSWNLQKLANKKRLCRTHRKICSRKRACYGLFSIHIM